MFQPQFSLSPLLLLPLACPPTSMGVLAHWEDCQIFGILLILKILEFL